MARKKRKKSHGTRRRRHRSMGAVNIQQVGMKVAGIAVSAFADNLVKKNFTSLTPTILGFIELGAGAMLPEVMKSTLGQGIGDGLIAVGAINLLKSFNVISGIGAPMPARVPLRRGAYGPNAPAIGAAGRAYLTETVGNTMMMPSMESEMMGALLYEE